MKCRKIRTLDRYLQGQLYGQKLIAFEDHLVKCPDCQSHIDDARKRDTVLRALRSKKRKTRSSARRNSSRGSTSSKRGHFLSGPGGTPLEIHIPRNTLLNERFRIIEELHNTGSSAVYHAFDTQLEEGVALKTVVVDPKDAQSATEHLKHEPILQRRICDFEHVTNVYDIHTFDYGGRSLLALSMEYADKGNLRSWLEENKRDKERRISVGLGFVKK